MIMSLLYAILVFAGLACLWGIVLSLLHHFFPKQIDPLVEAVDKLLPQIQCGQCGYPGCRPYAQALINDNAAINLCPPGGDRTIKLLAQHLQRFVAPLEKTFIPDRVAMIIEADCIGCTKCIAACPVDAIIGASKQMHTILYDICTGCELCIAPCPTDCITMVTKNDPRIDVV